MDSINNTLNEWKSLIDNAKELKEDEWNEHPKVPGVKFLNLEIKEINLGSKENHELTFNYTYDKIEKL